MINFSLFTKALGATIPAAATDDTRGAYLKRVYFICKDMKLLIFASTGQCMASVEIPVQLPDAMFCASAQNCTNLLSHFRGAPSDVMTVYVSVGAVIFTVEGFPAYVLPTDDDKFSKEQYEKALPEGEPTLAPVQVRAPHLKMVSFILQILGLDECELKTRDEWGKVSFTASSMFFDFKYVCMAVGQ